MKKWFPIAFIVLLAVTAAFVYRQIQPPVEIREYRLTNPSSTLVIDPGHGGYDPGAIADDGTLEKDLSLVLAGRIGEKLHTLRPDVQILYTRTGDTVSWPDNEVEDLQARTTYGGDAFLSIHFNTAQNTDAYGSFGFIRSDDSFSAQVHTLINQYLEDTPFTGLNLKTTDSQSIYVVDSQSIPAMLYEGGFLSNKTELANLKNPRKLDMMADAIARAYADLLP